MPIISFPGHKLHGAWCCDGYGPSGAPDSCTACVLSLCTVCGGAESSLPTDCPGEKMYGVIEDEVTAGNIDYLHRFGWIQLRKTQYRNG